MTRSSARMPMTTLTKKGREVWCRSPKVVSFAAKVTARIGKRLLTRPVPIRVMLMLLIQRLARPQSCSNLPFHHL